MVVVVVVVVAVVVVVVVVCTEVMVVVVVAHGGVHVVNVNQCGHGRRRHSVPSTPMVKCKLNFTTGRSYQPWDGGVRMGPRS